MKRLSFPTKAVAQASGLSYAMPMASEGVSSGYMNGRNDSRDAMVAQQVGV